MVVCSVVPTATEGIHATTRDTGATAILVSQQLCGQRRVLAVVVGATRHEQGADLPQRSQCGAVLCELKDRPRRGAAEPLLPARTLAAHRSVQPVGAL
jgi:hypothetical protein